MAAQLLPPGVRDGAGQESVRATAFGTLTFFNNALGLAAGPILTGLLADRLGLQAAMRYVPLAAVGAVVLLLAGRRAYPTSIERLESPATGATDRSR
ncbi:hypothetical protein [Couchioplanes azureus]|uniref:hypothetical protein n=1 Tax=Couchioplanes caeruleus TaxID=56438 RepID=UPI00166FE66A|nr:hypothetical protein [Couchioplanes caeruleus]GGQ82740.1 hypothetical protein GCM10010166_61140 [Couchioplanes caeruleus subsp. azureus]